MQTLTTRSASAQTGQVGLGTRFIQKDQLRRVEARLLATPGATGLGDIRPVLLTGPESLFLYVRPIRFRA